MAYEILKEPEKSAVIGRVHNMADTPEPVHNMAAVQSLAACSQHGCHSRARSHHGCHPKVSSRHVRHSRVLSRYGPHSRVSSQIKTMMLLVFYRFGNTLMLMIMATLKGKSWMTFSGTCLRNWGQRIR